MTEAGGEEHTGEPTRAHPDDFRTALTTWLEASVTPEVVDLGQGVATEQTMPGHREWNRRLADDGWAAPAWPTEHGGRDAGLDEQLIYLEEMHRARAPGPINVIGVSNIAPAIMAYGTGDQQATYLRPMLRGDQIWSQGMSEPDAGSDLASLRCRAVLDGDHFVLNGQKTWNSLGHLADWCQLYVRTDPTVSKHKGISCLLVDLRTPGIEVRPVRTMTGETAFSELFLTDARVPTSALLGPLNEGWRVAMTTLSFERAGVARLHMGLSRKLADLLSEPAAKAAVADPTVRDRIARVHSEISCMRWNVNRSFARIRGGDQPGGADGSMTKLMWARIDQEIGALALDVLGMAALDGPWARNLASSRSSSIAGGTTEINLNIVAEQGLGLPREPQRN